jgi:hypothetical protein
VSHYDLQALHGQPAVQQVRAIDRYRLTIDRAFGPGMADALDRFATVAAARPAVTLPKRCVRTRMEFAAQSLSEHAENVVQRARADIEAVVMVKAQQLGLNPGDLGIPPQLEAREAADA